MSKRKCESGKHHPPKLFDDKDLCQDGYCRECHVSLSFEECCDGSWVNRQRAAMGMPPTS